VTILTVLVFILGFTFYSFFTAQRQLEEKLQVVTLLGAQEINGNDRLGQINNMTAAGRELLYNSRSACANASVYHPEIMPLATSLADESEIGAELILAERTATFNAILADVTTSIETAKRAGLVKTGFLDLPWMQRDDVAIDAVSLGYCAEINANVAAPIGDDALNAFDKKYIDNKTLLYFANVQIPLAEPDNKLQFCLSSLDAPVRGTISPLRLIPAKNFRQLFSFDMSGKKTILVKPSDYIPSTLLIKAHQSVHVKFPVQMDDTIAATVSATTNGASPMP